jgi:hypothetical protein
MTRYYKLEPEVGGGIGPATTGNLTVRPPRLSHFNYEFDIWPRDPLLEAISTYIVTDALKDRLIEAAASGVRFADVEVSTSDIYQELHPGRALPSFTWMQICGEPCKDDFGLSASGDLIVSKRMLDLLRQAGMKNCDIEELR